ncbi:MAG: hypothetical protein F6K15_32770 [Okeania sp. SIO2B3]|nr:hypothetical protein [Okeania sp. SIO2B3]
MIKSSFFSNRIKSVQELQTTSRSPNLRKAAKQMLEGLQTLELAKQTDRAKSVKTQAAIYEILTK